MSPTHISIRNLLRLNVLVQFLLTIFQTHCDIRRALGPPEEIKVIAETLALLKGRPRPKHPILALKSNGSVVKRCRFLARRIRISANCRRCLADDLICFGCFFTLTEKLRLSK